MNPLLLPVLIPAAAGVLCLLCGKRLAKLSGAILVLAMLANLGATLAVFKKPLALAYEFGRADFALAFRLDPLSSFILAAAAVLGLLVAVYSASFMKGKPKASLFYTFFLFTFVGVNGAIEADHLLTLLFFWESMAVSLYVMISLGHPGAYKTAVKAFFIGGVADLCLLAGIALVVLQAGTLTVSEIHLSTEGLGGLAFVLLAIGAMGRAGAMPFHSWIPDAAVDAPTPFMALLPGILEKLAGIYLLARVSLDMFTIGHGWASMLLMVVGAATLLLAVLMALVQKDYKRLLAFHAISQVGYMILGIGTGTTIGIVGGLFHMLNNGMYKGALFLTSGAVERQAGTTDLNKLGGLASKMPVTFVCFVLAALSISGVPPFNGFYSKELIYDAALERGTIFYAIAALGSFFTAASFLKLGHAAFKGPFRAVVADVKEAPLAMLAPTAVIVLGCLGFGLGNALPIDEWLVPAVARHVTQGVHLSGPLPASWTLTGITLAVLLAATLNHIWGAKRTGGGLGAVDHIHYAPVAHQLYDAAERRWFDPYVIALKFFAGFAYLASTVDRAVDFVTDTMTVSIVGGASATIRRAHTGSHTMYLAWSLVGMAALAVYFLLGGF